MSEPTATPSSNAPPSSDPAAGIDHGPPPVRIGLILKFILPLALFMLVGGLSWGYYDIPAKVNEWLKPPRVAATGQVFFGDEPLSRGELQTLPVASGLKGAMGFLDDEGRFKLEMDIQGTYSDGAHVGEHKVSVKKTDPNSPPGAREPDLLTPREYYVFETTPLRITLDRDPSKNHFVIRIPRPDGAAPLPASPSGGPGARGPINPDR